MLRLLNEIHLIGVDGNLYSAEWSKMRLIFFVFGTMPDFMRNLKDLIHTVRITQFTQLEIKKQREKHCSEYSHPCRGISRPYNTRHVFEC